MTDVALNETALHRWRSDPLSFIEEVLHDPETGKPFVLLEAERAFMRRAFALDADGRLAYPEQCYGAPKKSGKTTRRRRRLCGIREGYLRALAQMMHQSLAPSALAKIEEQSVNTLANAQIDLDSRIAAAFSDGITSPEIAGLIKETQAASLSAEERADAARGARWTPYYQLRRSMPLDARWRTPGFARSACRTR